MPKTLRFCQNGEISPNLVTLLILVHVGKWYRVSRLLKWLFSRIRYKLDKNDAFCTIRFDRNQLLQSSCRNLWQYLLTARGPFHNTLFVIIDNHLTVNYGNLWSKFGRNYKCVIYRFVKVLRKWSMKIGKFKKVGCTRIAFSRLFCNICYVIYVMVVL